jgi:hypothetical protein
MAEINISEATTSVSAGLRAHAEPIHVEEITSPVFGTPRPAIIGLNPAHAFSGSAGAITAPAVLHGHSRVAKLKGLCLHVSLGIAFAWIGEGVHRSLLTGGFGAFISWLTEQLWPRVL